MRSGIFALLLLATLNAQALDKEPVASPMVVDAAGRVIGYLAAHGCSADQGESQFAFISATAYAGCVSAVSGRIGARLAPPGSSWLVQNDLGFKSPDCSGQAMLCVPAAGYLAGGFIIRTRPGITYAAHGQQSELTGINSEIKGGYSEKCTPLVTPTQMSCVSASFFNAQELGVQWSNYQAPLSIAVIDDNLLLDVIFFDGVDPDGVWQ